MSSYIPLSVPSLKGNEWKYIKECLDMEWVSSAGKYVDLFEEKIAKYTGAKYAVACINGTSALQLSLRLVGIEPGDEVIVPTLTFIATVNAVSYNGAGRDRPAAGNARRTATGESHRLPVLRASGMSLHGSLLARRAQPHQDSL